MWRPAKASCSPISTNTSGTMDLLDHLSLVAEKLEWQSDLQQSCFFFRNSLKILCPFISGPLKYTHIKNVLSPRNSEVHWAQWIFFGYREGQKEQLNFYVKRIPWYGPYHCAYKLSPSLELWILFGFILTSDTEMSYKKKKIKQLLLLGQKMQSAYHQCNGLT